MTIYETIYYDYAVEENRKRLIDLIDAAFFDFFFKTHEEVIKKVEKKIKKKTIKKIEEKAACEKKKSSKK